MLNKDYRDLLQNLSDREVKFIVVGAYALGAHGFVRATGDIDIWVETGAETEEQAALSYELWKMGDKRRSRKDRALNIYRNLHEKAQKYYYKKRIKELSNSED